MSAGGHCSCWRSAWLLEVSVIVSAAGDDRPAAASARQGEHIKK